MTQRAKSREDEFTYICGHYGVPARLGGRVRYTGDPDHPEGTIVGTTAHYLRIRLDGEKEPCTFHPTWALTYLDGSTSRENGSA